MYNWWQALKDWITGDLKCVTEQVAASRLDICKKCEAFDPQLNICTVCACYMPIKVKLEKAECPMEKW